MQVLPRDAVTQNDPHNWPTKLINFTGKFHNQSEPSERNNKFLFFVLNIPMENYRKCLLFCNFTYVDLKFDFSSIGLH